MTPNQRETLKHLAYLLVSSAIIVFMIFFLSSCKPHRCREIELRDELIETRHQLADTKQGIEAVRRCIKLTKANRYGCNLVGCIEAERQLEEWERNSNK
jgi:hypothetical protein